MRLTVGKQIMVACLLVVVAFTGLNMYTYYQMQVIDEGNEGIIRRSVPLVIEVKDLNIELKDQAAAVRGYLVTGDSNYMATYDRSRQTMKATMDNLEQKLITPEGKQKVVALRDVLAEYHRTTEQTITTYRAKGITEAMVVMASARDKNNAAEKTMQETVVFLTERMELRIK